MKKFFVTATDTDAGKTHISYGLLRAFSQKNVKSIGYKPISAGCELVNGELVNRDAQMLLSASNVGVTLQEVNPIAYLEPIAPHIAAAKQHQHITVEQVERGFEALCKKTPDVVLTEGAGGWRLPLGQGVYLSDFAISTGQEVILVVNMKLGCLNHAILTYQSILNDGLKCVGWVANCFQEMPYLQENIEELAQVFTAPLLGKIPFVNSADEISDHLDISPLM